MFIDDLKKSILQKAIQWKLVEQNPNDEPASELLKRIIDEKEKLIKDGKIKKEKPLEPITDEEKLFDIPSSWTWARFWSLCINHDNERKPVSKWDRISKEWTYNYYWATWAIDKVDDYIFDWEYLMIWEDWWNFYTIRDNSFIANWKFWANNHVHVTEPVLVDIKYLKHYLDTLNLPALWLIHWIAVPKLNQACLNWICVALPPLEEQKRIVAKLDELMPLLDEARPLEEEITKLEKDFPSKLRQSILQYAIQWKLVEQNSTDEPASELLKKIKEEKEKLVKEWKIKKEKPLEPIKDEEKPFDIPSSWEWVRLGEISTKITDWTHSTPKYTTEWVPFLSVKNMSSWKIIFDDLKYITEEEHNILYKRCNPEKWDLLISKVWTTWVPAIVETDEEFSLFVSLALVKSLWNLIDVHYLWYVIQSPVVQEQVKENTRGVWNKNWVLDAVISTYFPLPPLEEQKRIVAKLDELVKLCDELEEQINL